MKAWAIALGLSAVLIAANAAQGQAVPYQGMVVGTNVYVRSGPSTGSYPVTKLSEPATVTVVEKVSEEWLAIQPVRGCYGVISAQYVQVDETGKIGTITGDAVLVRAAGELRTRDFDTPLGRRNRGDRVRLIGRVVGADGRVEWYVIKPPSDMRFYISAQFVRPIGGETPPAAPTETPSAVPSAAETPPAETPVPAAPTAAVSSPVREELAALRAIRALEKDLIAESAKPIDQRNFNDILARAEAIHLPPDSRFRPVYESLMSYLREEVALVENTRQTERQMDAILRQATEKRVETYYPPVAPPATAMGEVNRPYELQGLLSVSMLYTLADPAQPRRYVVRNPQTKAVLGYVQSTDGKVRLSDYEGKIVGIRGQIRFDDSISMKILEAESVTVLSSPPLEKPVEVTPAPVKPEGPPAAAAEPAPAAVPVQPSPSPMQAVKPAVEPAAPPPPPRPIAAPAEPAVAPQPQPEPAQPIRPEPRPEPAAAIAEPPRPQPAPQPVAEPVPEPAAPQPEPAPVAVPAPAEKPVEPESARPSAMVEPAEPEPAPVAPVAEPAEQPAAQPEEVKPVPAVVPEPVAPPPATVEEPEPQPVPVKKPAPEPAEVAPPEPVAPPAPETAKPARPVPANIQPMEIQPINVKPMEIDSPVVKEAPAAPARPTAPSEASVRQPAAAPAENEPAPAEPEMKMFEVETTEGDVEVEWD